MRFYDSNDPNEGRKIELDTEAREKVDAIIRKDATARMFQRMLSDRSEELQAEMWQAIHEAHPETADYNCSYNMQTGVVCLEMKKPEGVEAIAYFASVMSDEQKDEFADDLKWLQRKLQEESERAQAAKFN